jgi:hypothetical protein
MVENALPAVQGGDRITIVLRLPMDVHKINTVLNALADTWPLASIDLNGPDGWLIAVGPDGEA